jgi:hypothetical protein
MEPTVSCKLISSSMTFKITRPDIIGIVTGN